ncbi:uncharacterized protein LOC123527732, partial [Mercenaria mercenaria]|uniref:uncharacterized protein LOC123527732 n=1 Tax=Mercenaria mercenaria TaxID=6596 RepID=UPI00234E58CA
EQTTAVEEEHNDSFRGISGTYIQTKIDFSCQRTRTTYHQINRTTQVEKKEIIHYKVPLTCWPRLQHSQELVETLVGYCQGLENKLKLPGTVKQHVENIDNVNVFVRGNAFDIKCLTAEPEKRLQQETEIFFISENLTNHSINRLEGIFIDSKGVRLVDAVSETTLYVKDDIIMTNECQNIISEISSLIEVALFKPLLEKIELLRNLIFASSCDIKEGCLHAVQEKTTILYDRLRTSDPLNVVEDRPNAHIDGMDYKLNQDIIINIRQHKNQIDRLIGEMIALTNRSTLPEKMRPVVEGYKTKEINKQTAEDLFKLHSTIKWCGYRYSTLHINVEHISDSFENDRRNEKIKAFLSRKHINDYRIDIIESQIKEYNYVGAEIQSETRTKATLGCFSVYRKGNQKTVCCLLSKHFVLGSSRIFVDDKVHFGTVLPATNEEGGQDIAAAKIVERHLQDLDMNFKNYEDQPRPAFLYDNTDNKMLQDQPVYLRGAMTKLGVGTIHIPTLQCCDDTDADYIQIIDGNFTLKMPFERLAVEGDSGSIICMDELGTKNVCVISMLMGELLRKSEEEQRVYSTLRLSCALKYLEDKTQGKFILGGTVSGKEIVDQILRDLLESLPTGTNEIDQGEKTISLRK